MQTNHLKRHPIASGITTMNGVPVHYPVGVAKNLAHDRYYPQLKTEVKNVMEIQRKRNCVTLINVQSIVYGMSSAIGVNAHNHVAMVRNQEQDQYLRKLKMEDSNVCVMQQKRFPATCAIALLIVDGLTMGNGAPVPRVAATEIKRVFVYNRT